MFPNYRPLTLAMICLISTCTVLTVHIANLNANTLINTNQIVQKTPNAIFKPILTEIEAKAQFPIRLPTYIPEADRSMPIYASLQTVTLTRYRIELAYTKDCYGATACRLGEVAGEKKSGHSVLKGQKVTLAKGIIGYFTPATCGASCSDATLKWEQDGARYTVALKAGSVGQLTQMANSAIATTPMNNSKQGTQTTSSVLGKFIHFNLKAVTLKTEISPIYRVHFLNSRRFLIG